MISVHKPGLTHIYQVYLVNVEINQVLQTLSYSLINIVGKPNAQ